MNANVNLLGTEDQRGEREGHDGAIRRIGEILPLVMARYQLSPLDRLREASEEFSI